MRLSFATSILSTATAVARNSSSALVSSCFLPGSNYKILCHSSTTSRTSTGQVHPVPGKTVPLLSNSEMAPQKKRQKKDPRCSWCLQAPDYVKYHDEEWGTPLYDDYKMFEFLILETFQAGLNWLLILRKRENFAAAFHNFDVDRIAEMTEEDVDRLMHDKGIVRNRLKIRAAISNARAVIEMRENGIGLADYFWKWVDHKPQKNFTDGSFISKNQLSDDISKDLKKKGFKFVGSTVVYAHLQATGIVNDHVPTCPRFSQVEKLVRPKKPE